MKRCTKSWHFLIIFLISMFLGLYLHWPAIKDPTRLTEDWRQSPHWQSADQQNFQKDDPLIAYAKMNTSPLENAIYKIESYFGDTIFFGKINAIVFFALTAMAIFAAGLSFGHLFSAWTATIIFMFFPSVFEHFAGGFSHCWMYGLSALTVLLINRGKWKWLTPLMAIESIGYPPAAVLTAVMILVDIGFTDLKKFYSNLTLSAFKSLALKNPALKKKYILIVLAFSLSFIIMGRKYISPSNDFGHIVSKTEIAQRVEFTKKGRYAIIPVQHLHHELYKYFGGPFFILMALLALIFLRKRFFNLPRGLYALLAASMILYLLATVFLLKLYIPARYTRYALPIFIALAGGYWLNSIRIHFNNYKWTVCLCLSLVIVGTITFREQIRPGIATSRFKSKQLLYAFVRDLPGTPLIAAPPYLGSDLPLFSGKSVLVSYELSHPWWTGHWNMVSERTQDFYSAYYAPNQERLKQVVGKYGIDYWVVDRMHFQKRYLARKRFYMGPFNSWIKKELRPSSSSFIRDTPEKYRIYDDGRYFIVPVNGIFLQSENVSLD